MKRYWFSFNAECLPIGVQHGCGLSANSYEDALNILREKVFESSDIPEIGDVVENVDISTLDKAHVLSNMGNISVRGVWYPLGY